jgi:magnesium-transporting ATPase (P-type)
MSTIHRINLAENMPFAGAGTDYLVCVKGAPDVVLRHSQSYIDGAGEVHPIHAAIHGQIAAANSAMAHQALRVLGLAYRPLTSLPQTVQAAEIEQNLIFLGLIGIIDPPRPRSTGRHCQGQKSWHSFHYDYRRLCIDRQSYCVTDWFIKPKRQGVERLRFG